MASTECGVDRASGNDRNGPSHPCGEEIPDFPDRLRAAGIAEEDFKNVMQKCLDAEYCKIATLPCTIATGGLGVVFFCIPDCDGVSFTLCHRCISCSFATVYHSLYATHGRSGNSPSDLGAESSSAGAGVAPGVAPSSPKRAARVLACEDGVETQHPRAHAPDRAAHALAEAAAEASMAGAADAGEADGSILRVSALSALSSRPLSELPP